MTRCRVWVHRHTTLSERVDRASLTPAILVTRLCNFSSYVMALTTHMPFDSAKYSPTADNSALAQSLTLANSSAVCSIRSFPASCASRPVNDQLDTCCLELLVLLLCRWQFTGKLRAVSFCNLEPLHCLLGAASMTSHFNSDASLSLTRNLASTSA